MRLKFVMFTLFCILYGLFFYTHTQRKDQDIAIALDKSIKNLETHYFLTKDYFLTDVKSIQGDITKNKELLRILSKAKTADEKQKQILRDKLFDILSPLYEKIKLRGILQFHFVFPGNISFLRMHKPDKFGDNLTNIRYSFRYANEQKKAIEGFEQGRTTHGFRYVFPLFDQHNNHLGAVEITLASYTLQSKLLSINKIHSHFLVNKNIFNVKAWETKNLIQKYIPSIENENYMFSLTNDSYHNQLKKSQKYIIKPLKEQIKTNIKTHKAFALHVPYENTIKVVSFLPIKSTQNQVVAYLVSYTNNNNIYNICRDYKGLNVIIFVALLFLFYFIYRNLTYKQELEIEVIKKTKELQLSKDRLKDINENLEQKIIIEVDKSKKIEHKLFESEKLASMGNMIGNIAHQWRQPLSVISTGATGMQMQKEYGTLTDENFNKTCTAINENAQYLSKTIDDFRNYIKGDREKSNFDLKEEIKSFLNLVNASIINNNLNIILDLEDGITIHGYKNELSQCLINIFNNAKDAIKENKSLKENCIFISTLRSNNSIKIVIKDNAGGIDDTILPNIFEPYFTTKHKSQGTGLGLHLTYNLIVEGMKGTVVAKNEIFTYKNEQYTGAVFTISLPLS